MRRALNRTQINIARKLAAAGQSVEEIARALNATTECVGNFVQPKKPKRSRAKPKPTADPVPPESKEVGD